MSEYFVEFEFESLRNIYWFPLIINSNTEEEALKLKLAVEISLKENCIIHRSSEPKLIIDKINSEFINDYIKGRMKGKIIPLNVQVWKFKDIPNSPELSFSSHLNLYKDSIVAYIDKSLANLIEMDCFPVKQIYSQNNLDEFFLINIVKPD